MVCTSTQMTQLRHGAPASSWLHVHMSPKKVLTDCACAVTTGAGDRTRLTAEAKLRLHRLGVAVTRAADDVTRVERHRDAHARHAARIVTQL